MLETWKQFIEGQPLGSEPAKAILESWERCRAFRVDTARAQLRRVPLDELNARLARRASLVEAARKHLVWALASLEPLHPVIVILTDQDGIVLHSVGNAPEAMTAYGLVPGYDWSERAMGTNGIGTALSFGAAVAVVGAEHYTETWHNNTCVGSPVRGPDGEIWGAVDISTSAGDGDPARLVLVAFLAHVIGLELGRTDDRSYAADTLLDRASAAGSSAKRAELEEGARSLALLEQDLLLNARADASARTRNEPTRIETVLSAAVDGHVGARVAAPEVPEYVDLAAPVVFQRALTHLVNVLRRSADGPVDVSVSASGPTLLVRFEGAKRRSPSNNLDRAGVALGEWLTRQLLAVSGATLQRADESERVAYVVRLPLRSTVFV